MYNFWPKCGYYALICLPAGLILFGPSWHEVPESLPSKQIPPTPLAAQFERASTGTIQGRVRWHGKIPQIEPFISHDNPMRPNRGTGGRKPWPNPHAPDIDPKTKGLADAVVFLRHVDAERSKPWEHPPLRIEAKRFQLRVHQGESVSKVGFVRRGTAIEMVHHDPWLYSIRARGDAFFNMICPQPNQPARRKLEREGHVIFQSGSGRFWMRNHVFVTEHPYFARTDQHGRFTLTEVPPGNYELVCWIPNWRVTAKERHWNTTQIIRVDFAESVELTRSISVDIAKTAVIDFHIDSAMFSTK